MVQVDLEVSRKIKIYIYYYYVLLNEKGNKCKKLWKIRLECFLDIIGLLYLETQKYGCLYKIIQLICKYKWKEFCQLILLSEVLLIIDGFYGGIYLFRFVKLFRYYFNDL